MGIHKHPALDEQRLQSFKKELLDQRKELLLELNRLGSELSGQGRSQERNDSYGDDADRDQIRQRLVTKMKDYRKKLRKVEAALARIANKTYGLDEETGDPIPLERLEVMPTATTTI